MTHTRTAAALPLAVAALCALAWPAAGADAIRAGDTCIVAAAQSPVRAGGSVVAQLPRGQRVSVLKVFGSWARVQAEVNGATFKGLMPLKDIALDPAAARGPAAQPRVRRPKPAARRDDEPKPAAKLPARKGEWPQFRGPNRDGKSIEKGLRKRWPATGPKHLWTFRDCGVGYSSISISGGMIYTAGNVGDGVSVVALDLDGKGVWSTPVGESYGTGYPGPRSTPTVNDGKLYFETPHGKVVCLDAKTGEVLWSVDMVQEFGARRITWAFAESPLVVDDYVICCPGGSRAGVAALNKGSGKTVWACTGVQDKAGYASPMLVDYKGLRQIVVMTASAAIGVGLDGDLLWRVEQPTKHGANIANPIFSDGAVFFSSGYGQGCQLLSLRVRGKRVSAVPVWAKRDLDNHHGGVVAVKGYVYGSNSRGRWLCVETRSGRVMYRDRGVGKGSVTYADGRLYCLAEKDGTVGLVPADPKGHVVVSRFSIPDGGEKCWAHPVVCDGRLYIRYGENLHAYDIKR